MSQKIKLHIVTPTAKILSTSVDEVVIPAENGEMGILPGHTPVLTFLGVGILKYHKESVCHMLAVQQGFAEVKDDEVTIITDQTFTADDIDLEEAKREMKEAEKTLSESDLSGENLEREQAKLAIARTKKEIHSKK